ncbi:aminotransferase class III-fold pyridoxal phosphate-dependent enzyme [Streptomyces sp. A3M-1-3]|uniref:aspartate aminotransferase family protein n=1 Tax=Streptomyces sp. A3M-1-3 TaxID=2962044 RepID=UPI0020B7252A|nr:aminotransferase class III-fold pyridoxal phosphate-dependent enzyme [Streptomyces sp. A3M-1-3]MCP3822748.1 aminotransferase class III-fold pyridoxal phosphate-dependent enzyme [Streptomyces sp. A3M-1-3]
MNSTSAEPELSEPFLLGWLSSLGLDVEYIRGEGNTLYFLGEDGREVPVLDFAGGYGSLIFGHNHPEIVAHAQNLLASQVPVHAQFSRHPYANDVALALNKIINRELGTVEPYSAIFANSGAEAVEAAVKHAELDRVLRAQALAEEIDAHFEEARSAVRGGTAAVSAAARAQLGLGGGESGGPDSAAVVLEELVAEVTRRNAEQSSRPPLFLSLEGAFHGKLVGSVQLTHNAGYRTPFTALAAQARFVPRERPGALKEIIENNRAAVLDVVTEGGDIRVVPRDFPVFCAFVLEPIQGEGGINVISEEFARDIQEVCATADVPIIVDEVQSGMGRSGTFLASSQVGLRADYYVLAKSLGGGLAKSSVMLVRKSRYRDEFELLHSSTFAKDAFSCHIAHKVLDMLEAEDGKAYRLATERGARLTEMFEAVRADFPHVIKGTRGLGLMLGLEFSDQSESTSEPLREQADFLGYVIAGYLLREHRIRTFPTASAVNTLRFEPSVLLTDAEIDRLEAGLRAVCGLLRDQDGESLVRL